MELEIRPSWRDQIGLLLLVAALAVASVWMLFSPISGLSPQVAVGALAVMALIALTVLLYRHYVWSFRIADSAIESCYGIISRNVHSIRIRDLRNINVRQSILQRILGIGDIEFSSAGGAGIEVTFVGIAAPLALKEEILQLEEMPGE